MGHSHSSALPYLNGDATKVTYSGFSAGCFMSHEMSIIYPNEIAGAVLVACWSYGDKNTFVDLSTAQEYADASIARIDSNIADGKIGAKADVANQKIYIWTGE